MTKRAASLNRESFAADGGDCSSRAGCERLDSVTTAGRVIISYRLWFGRRERRRRSNHLQPVRRINASAILVNYRQRCNTLDQRLVTNLGDRVNILWSFRPGTQPPQVCGPSSDVRNPGGLVGVDQGP